MVAAAEAVAAVAVIIINPIYHFTHGDSRLYTALVAPRRAKSESVTDQPTDGRTLRWSRFVATKNIEAILIQETKFQGNKGLESL